MSDTYNLPLLRSTLALGTTLLAACQPGLHKQQGDVAQQPNVIYILADDAGYGDLSCYGQQKFATPNLDRLASEGMRFTQHYAGASVSAPSRSTLMTGLHTGHTPIRGNEEILPEGQHPMPDSLLTLPKLFQQAGYATGAFGKWGLGYPGSEGSPGRQGFGEFFGYNCQRIAHNYFPDYLRRNDEKVVLEGNKNNVNGEYAHHVIDKEALAFLDAHKDEKFFMYLPIVLPHAELLVPEDSIFQHFKGQYVEEHPYKGIDSGPSYRNGGYGSQPYPRAAFAAMMTHLDNTVGMVMEKLKALGLDKNTIVIFASDNGAHIEGGADPMFFDSNGPLRGLKRELYEGGIRVPMIVRWPGQVAAGTTSDHISAFWDVMPTLAQAAALPLPKDVRIDGISFLPALTGKGKQQQHAHLYWEFHEAGGRQAVRMGEWKGVREGVGKNPQAPVQLYHLPTDLGETKDVAAQHPEVVRQIERLMAESRTESALFRFGRPAPAR